MSQGGIKSLRLWRSFMALSIEIFVMALSEIKSESIFRNCVKGENGVKSSDASTISVTYIRGKLLELLAPQDVIMHTWV